MPADAAKGFLRLPFSRPGGFQAMLERGDGLAGLGPLLAESRHGSNGQVYIPVGSGFGGFGDDLFEHLTILIAWGAFHTARVTPTRTPIGFKRAAPSPSKLAAPPQADSHGQTWVGEVEGSGCGTIAPGPLP